MTVPWRAPDLAQLIVQVDDGRQGLFAVAEQGLAAQGVDSGPAGGPPVRGRPGRHGRRCPSRRAGRPVRRKTPRSVSQPVRQGPKSISWELAIHSRGWRASRPRSMIVPLSRYSRSPIRTRPSVPGGDRPGVRPVSLLTRSPAVGARWRPPARPGRGRTSGGCAPSRARPRRIRTLVRYRSAITSANSASMALRRYDPLGVSSPLSGAEVPVQDREVDHPFVGGQDGIGGGDDLLEIFAAFLVGSVRDCRTSSSSSGTISRVL